MAKREYKTVIRIRSMSHRDKIYTIKEDVNGHLTCGCPAWIFKHGGLDKDGNRTCKHIEVYHNVDVFTKIQKMAVDGVIEEGDMLGRD